MQLSEHQLVVIGGGPAGMAAAYEAARLGADVTLVERERLGGRATWHSLLPSKTWLAIAGRRLSLGPSDIAPDLKALTGRIADLSRTMSGRYHKRLESAGVKVVQGEASFVDPELVRIGRAGGEDIVEPDSVIIATGSGPIFLPNVKPDPMRIIAPRFMGKLAELPRSLIMIGAGATGAEFAYMFNALGVDVTLVTDLPYILLPRFDDEIRGRLEAVLAARGVAIRKSSPVESAADGGGVTVALRGGETLRADMAFVAIGRAPHLDGLNLEAACIEAGRRGIPVDEFGRTSEMGIYAAGDVTGPPMTANKGMAQGYIAARHALGAPVAPYRSETVVEAVYTGPEAAQVGMTEAEANGAGRVVRVVRCEYTDNLKANLDGEPAGLLKLVIDAEDKTVLGGAALGPHAVDAMAPLAVALQQGARTRDLAAVFAGHPTMGELLFEAAREV
ncbi:MAG: NAD(P)/FAD-dependent oxidoreductase [Anaerolineae bacterium]|nr:NAD(P)/FAD-dependent oxidoreductase [Anaerolineae bacterium]